MHVHCAVVPARFHAQLVYIMCVCERHDDSQAFAVAVSSRNSPHRGLQCVCVCTGMRCRPPAAGPWLRGCASAVAFSVLALRGRAQLRADDPAPEYTFGLPSQPTAHSVQQVITGDLRVEGQISVDREGDIRLVVSSALSKVCENKSVPVLVDSVLDIDSFGSLRPEFVMTWALLPPLGGGQYCLESLAMVSYGNAEPPFDEVIGPPPFRDMLQMELKGHGPTNLVRIDNWKIDVANMSCDFRYVVAPLDLAYTRYTTTAPPGGTAKPPEACRDGDPLMPKWIPPDKQAAPINPGTCTYAVHPCTCAAFSNCTWRSNPGGGYWCQPALPDERVTCTFCPLQADCPLDAGDICALVTSPCACASSAGKCRWDLDIQTCVPRSGGSTPCSACTAQLFCSRPFVVGVQPAQGGDLLDIMGDPEVGWVANISFDRLVSLDLHGRERGVQLHCRSTTEDVYTTFTISPSKLAIFANETHTMLQIDTSGSLNDRMRECNVVIESNVLRDRDHVFFGGMARGEAQFLLVDDVRPTLDRFAPPNSQVGVAINATVTMIFDESVLPTNDSFLTLLQLGGDWDGGVKGVADEVIAKIPLQGDRVVFGDDGKNVTVDFGGIIDTFVLYSFFVSAGAIADAAGNPWVGIKVGLYNFRTTSRVFAIAGASAEDHLERYIALCVGGVVAAACVVASLIALCRACKLRRALKQQDGGSPEPLKATVPDPLTSVERHYSTGVLADIDEKDKMQASSERRNRIRASQISPSSPRSPRSPRRTQVMAWREASLRESAREPSPSRSARSGAASPASPASPTSPTFPSSPSPKASGTARSLRASASDGRRSASPRPPRMAGALW